MRACLVTGFVVVAPSGNIHCHLTKQSARCDIVKRDWTPPAKPRSCELDFGRGVFVEPRGRADHVCAGDTTMNDGGRLTYGATPARGTLRCRSARSGMRCSSLRSGHGFSLLRRRVRFF